MKRVIDLVPSRRDVLKWGGLALAGTCVNQIAGPLKVSAQGKAKPRGTARNLIVIELAGAISPYDCFDFHETYKQPKDLNVQKTSTGVYLSKTLFPTLFDNMDKVALVRSMRANELVHFNGQYHTQTGRALNVALAKEIPAFGSVIAMELESQRRDTDTFPAYFTSTLGTGFAGSIGAGFLPPRFSGVDLTATAVFEMFGAGEESAGEGKSASKVLEARWDFLSGLSEMSMADRKSMGTKESDYKAYYYDAYRILNDPRWTKVFKVSEDEKKRYGADEYGLGLILARNLLTANAGTRVVYVYDGNRWDQHTRIFDRTAQSNHYVNCVRFDKGYTSLLLDLAKTPGVTPGKSLLDETLIVATSEFGRTPEINPVMGRHHWNNNYTQVFAGGGIKGGRVVGKTDKGFATETGWKNKEQPYMDNTVASIYSALGIDWKKRIENTPSKRAYDYVQSAPVGGNAFIATDPIDELFM